MKLVSLWVSHVGSTTIGLNSRSEGYGMLMQGEYDFHVFSSIVLIMWTFGIP